MIFFLFHLNVFFSPLKVTFSVLTQTKMSEEKAKAHRDGPSSEFWPEVLDCIQAKAWRSYVVDIKDAD